MCLLVRVPKTDLLRAILQWAKCKREKLELKKRDHIYGLTRLEEETQALEMIVHWVGRCGKEALKRAEYELDERKVKFTHVEQHVQQLLKLMEQEYWLTQLPTSSRTDGPGRGMPVLLGKQIFKSMLEDIGTSRRSGLRNFTIEDQFSTILDRILRLSSWTPSSTHNEHLRELLRSALLIINKLGGSEEYHDFLRDFMKQHTALCAFTLDNADLITTEDSETTAE